MSVGEHGTPRLAPGDAPDEANLPASARFRDPRRIVRFDECARDGRMRAAAILRHAQDLAWQHSEHLEYGRSWYEARGVGWVVRAVDLLIDRPERSNASLVGTTALVGFRHVMARRRTRLFAPGDRVMADATIDWVMTDRDGRPTRLPEEMRPFIEQVGATFVPTKIAPPTGEPLAVIDVSLRAADIDPLGHVNNAAWLEIVDEGLALVAPEQLAAERRRIRLEYLAVATGRRVRISLYRGDATGNLGLAVADEDGTPLLRGILGVMPRS